MVQHIKLQVSSKHITLSSRKFIVRIFALCGSRLFKKGGTIHKYSMYGYLARTFFFHAGINTETNHIQ